MSRLPDGRKAFVISLVLHGLVLGGLFLSAIWQWFNKPPPPAHIFQLYEPVADAPQQSSTEPAPSQPQAEQPKKLDLPDMPKLDEREVKIPERQPEPEPPPQKPKPKPQEKPKPQPKPEPKPQKVDYSQFLKTHDLPKNTPRPKPKPRKVNTPKLDVSSIKRELQQSLSAEDSARFQRMSSAQQNLLMSYSQRIRAIIDANFDRPDSLYQQVSAIVSFHVGADGRISGVRVVRSSGISIFDQAAIATFNRIGSFPPPPTGAFTFSVTFEMQE